MGICFSWPLAPGPGPQFVFTGPGTKFVFTGPGPQFVFTGSGSQFVFTGSEPKFVLTPNLYLPAQRGLSLHIPTLSPQFVLTDPGLWFVHTQVEWPTIMLDNVINSIIVYRSKYWSCTEKMVFFKVTALHSCQLDVRRNLCIKNE